jgi:hypothetical protein
MSLSSEAAMRPLHACLPALLALAGCSDPYPLAADLAASGAAAPYPELIPAERIAARVPPRGADPAPAIDARAAGLRARAARLRGPVIDAETDDRMRRGVDG